VPFISGLNLVATGVSLRLDRRDWYASGGRSLAASGSHTLRV